MQFEVNLLAVVVAGLAGMLPGAIINSPMVLNKAYMKELGEVNTASAIKPQYTPLFGLLVTLLNALVVNIVFSSSIILAPGNALEGFLYGVLLSVFALTTCLLAVVFDGRSWKWFGINALIQVLTFGVIGAVVAVMM